MSGGRELTAQGRQELFLVLRPFLTSDTADLTHMDAAARLGLSAGALKVALHRLRRRYGTLLRQRIERTVGSSEEVDKEITYLLEVLAGR